MLTDESVLFSLDSPGPRRLGHVTVQMSINIYSMNACTMLISIDTNHLDAQELQNGHLSVGYHPLI